MESRSIAQFVPPEFVVPAELLTTKFKLRLLCIDDVEKDFEAVTSSAAHLSKVWPDTGWPNLAEMRCTGRFGPIPDGRMGSR